MCMFLHLSRVIPCKYKQNRSNQARSDQIKSGQVRFRSDTVTSSQIGSAQENCSSDHIEIHDIWFMSMASLPLQSACRYHCHRKQAVT